jgi:hypothetical protein
MTAREHYRFYPCGVRVQHDTLFDASIPISTIKQRSRFLLHPLLFPLTNTFIMSEGTLHVTDSRTSKEYTIPIRRNSIAAADLKKIKGDATESNPADKVENGLRVYDPSLGNTAIDHGRMTWMYVMLLKSLEHQISKTVISDMIQKRRDRSHSFPRLHSRPTAR